MSGRPVGLAALSVVVPRPAAVGGNRLVGRIATPTYQLHNEISRRTNVALLRHCDFGVCSV